MSFYHFAATFYIGDLDETKEVTRENINASNKAEINLIISIFRLFRSCNSSSKPGLGNYRTYKKDNPYFTDLKEDIEVKIKEGIDSKFPFFMSLVEDSSSEESLFESFVETFELEAHEDSLYWAYDTCSFKKSDCMIIDATYEFNID